MRLFTSGDVCKIAGIPANTLDRWITLGLLDPANSGQGTGRHRLYGTAQVLAVTAGIRYRDEQAPFERVAGIVRLLASLSLERLEAHLAAGETWPVPAALLGDTPRPDCWLPGMLIKPPGAHEFVMSPRITAAMGRLDLKTIYADVQKKIANLSHRPAKRRPGRKRGMAGASKPVR